MSPVRRMIAVFFGPLLLVVLASCSNAAFGPEVLITREPIQPVAAAPVASPALPLAQAIVPATAGLAEVAAGDEQLAMAQPGVVAAATRQPIGPVLADPANSEPAPMLAATAAPEPQAESGLRPLEQTQNILLIGTDQKDLDTVGRTDTVIVLALDIANQRAALVSIPRDTYLAIPGYGYSRINQAYALGEQREPGGGVGLLASTIEKNFDIPIHNYVRIDFSGFKDVIDAVGGVDITVDCPIYDDNFWRFFGVGTLEKGTYRMTGEQALYYARSRKTTSDFDRSRRQQQVLMALRKEVMDAGLIPRIPALWLALRDAVDTDLDVKDIANLARLGAGFDRRHLYGFVPRPPLINDWVTPQGGMVEIPDLVAISDALDHIWERKPIEETNQEEKYCPMGR
jgi:LCP family protein required for cell wall assembly